jgi:hypothetical protein
MFRFGTKGIGDGLFTLKLAWLNQKQKIKGVYARGLAFILTAFFSGSAQQQLSEHRRFSDSRVPFDEDAGWCAVPIAWGGGEDVSLAQVPAMNK